MTQIDELVSQARLWTYETKCDGELACSLADALEAQAARVKELEALNVKLTYDFNLLNRDGAKLSVRIATLEEQLEAFRMAAERVGAIAESSFSVAHDEWWKSIPLTAFDALMSALRNTETKDG